MKFSRLRLAVAAVIFAVFALCIVFGIATGTLCGISLGDISLLCPLGALLAMISSKTLIPQGILSIILAAIVVFLLGRAFCGWLCPVSLWSSIATFFKPVNKRKAEEDNKRDLNREIACYEIGCEKNGGTADAVSGGKEESCALHGICKQKHKALDSRHAVLGGALIASLLCGFPVFCLVCPIGLSFATVSILVSLFGLGDLSWSLLFAPVVLVIEIVFMRKWCSRFCPVSALLNLVGRFSKTLVPRIDDSKCLEKVEGAACSNCATACKYEINLRHPEYGELPAHDCTRCMECVDACPADAISIRLLSAKKDEVDS